MAATLSTETDVPLVTGRHAVLRQELTLLERAAQRFFSDEEDRASAAVGDLQGLGSSRPS